MVAMTGSHTTMSDNTSEVIIRCQDDSSEVVCGGAGSSASKIIIGCQAIAEEILFCLQSNGLKTPLVTLDAGLHNRPNVLKEEMQSLLGRIHNADEILLAYGLCGNGLDGVFSPRCSLALPRVDDCIALVLGSRSLYRKMLGEKPGTYFVTRGFIRERITPWDDYERYKEKAGEEKAMLALKLMLAHYKRLCFIHTLPEDEPYVLRAKAMAELAGLEFEEAEGSLGLLGGLVRGSRDRDILSLEAGMKVSMSTLLM